MLRSYRSYIAVSLFLGISSAPAFSQSLQCNRKQTRCTTESTQLTIGDRVGVFTGDGELVATGEVKAMRGDRRAVLINKRHGAIRKGYKLSLLDTSGSDVRLQSSYRLYQEPAKMNVGGSMAYGGVSIGEGSPIMEVSGYAQWRSWRGIQLIGRGVFTSAEGEVTRYGDLGYERLPISMRGIGALGGVGYVLRENRPVSFRGELGLGLMHVSATVDGESGLVGDPGVRSKIENGVGAYARWSAGALWNMGAWHAHADFAQSLVHEALSYMLALGLSKDLK